jgi:hypothetical protein
LDKEGGGGSDDNVCDLERDILLAFEEQEKLQSAAAPSSPGPRRRSTKPLQNQSDSLWPTELRTLVDRFATNRSGGNSLFSFQNKELSLHHKVIETSYLLSPFSSSTYPRSASDIDDEDSTVPALLFIENVAFIIDRKSG